MLAAIGFALVVTNRALNKLIILDSYIRTFACDLPMRTFACDLPIRTFACDLPMRTFACDLPMRTFACDLPITFIISESDSITGAGDADIARDKISELSIHISLIVIINFMNVKAYSVPKSRSLI
jgi:hypothetical protein